MTTRRAFLTGLASLIAAPALVRASSLDYVPRGVKLIRPVTPKHPDILYQWYVDGVLAQEGTIPTFTMPCGANGKLLTLCQKPIWRSA